MQPPDHSDAAGDGGSGIVALIKVRDVVPHPLQGDVLQPKAVLIKPGEIAGEVIGVGIDGAGCRPEFSRKGIEPQLSQSLVGAHEILQVGWILPRHRVTDFLSKH